jgi:hypothetical protein
MFDNFTDYGVEISKIDIKKCIKYVSIAWNNVTGTTIANCWKKADILPKYEDEIDEQDRENRDIQLELERLKEIEEVQVLIDKLVFENPFTAEEFVQFDKSETTGEMISDEEILKAVLPNEQEQEKEREEDPLPVISHNEAIESYDKVILYLEQREDVFNVNKEELKFIKKLKKEALKQQFFSARQTNLDNFINIQ